MGDRLVGHFDDLAFGPGADRAPDKRAAEAGNEPWWKDFVPSQPHSRLNRDTAVQHSLRFNSQGFLYGFNNDSAFLGGLTSSLVGTGVPK